MNKISLRSHGYSTKLTAAERIKCLKKAIDIEGLDQVMSRMNELGNLQQARRGPAYHALLMDMAYILEKYKVPLSPAHDEEESEYEDHDDSDYEEESEYEDDDSEYEYEESDCEESNDKPIAANDPRIAEMQALVNQMSAQMEDLKKRLAIL